MPGKRMQLTLLIRTTDPAHDSMTVWSWYTESLGTGRAREPVPQTPYLQSSGWRIISLATGNTRTHAR